VIFTSNMFGSSYVFGVEVDKAAHPEPSQIHSTPELTSLYLQSQPAK
jgi:oligogalacturonide lyase